MLTRGMKCSDWSKEYQSEYDFAIWRSHREVEPSAGRSHGGIAHILHLVHVCRLMQVGDQSDFLTAVDRAN